MTKDNEILKVLDRCADTAYNCGSVTVSKADMMDIYGFVGRQQAEINRLKLKMSYMIDPNRIGDRHEMGG